MSLEDSPGAHYLGDGRCRFKVWAPFHQELKIHLLNPDRWIHLERGERGYHEVVVDQIEPGTRYFYQFPDGRDLPDPASLCQPEGVHGPSEVVNLEYAWDDPCWFGLPLERFVLYELHVGTFTEEGTFTSILPHLDILKELGITVVELMPVAQFPGGRNWGYDGVFPYAAQWSYGGIQGLQTLVNACHRKGLGVALDVVYNHLGPEGNYLAEFGPYFTDHYRTPWGSSINFDSADSDEVRRFFIQNALFWIRDCHIDCLRLDAVHAIIDNSPYPFLEELNDVVEQEATQLNRRVQLIAESALNDPRILNPRAAGGYGMAAQWNDDFHHALHTLLTGERSGYYENYGDIHHLAKAFREGYVYSGQYSSFHRRRHGRSSRHLVPKQFVVFAQNHDQVGNRALGERLTCLLSFEALKLAAGVVLLSPFVPLLFMGEEYGESAPFPFFVSHSDPELVEAVRKGRREEFKSFDWQATPPDPQSEETFWSAKLHLSLKESGKNETLWNFYQALIRLRKTLPSLISLSKGSDMGTGTLPGRRILMMQPTCGEESARMIVNFEQVKVPAPAPLPPGLWRLVLDSSAQEWGGPGTHVPPTLSATGKAEVILNPESFILLSRPE